MVIIAHNKSHSFILKVSYKILYQYFRNVLLTGAGVILDSVLCLNVFFINDRDKRASSFHPSIVFVCVYDLNETYRLAFVGGVRLKVKS